MELTLVERDGMVHWIFFLTNNLNFVRSRVEGCLYVLRKGDYWIKLINYVDDALYHANNDSFREVLRNN